MKGRYFKHRSVKMFMHERSAFKIENTWKLLSACGFDIFCFLGKDFTYGDFFPIPSTLVKPQPEKLVVLYPCG